MTDLTDLIKRLSAELEYRKAGIASNDETIDALLTEARDELERLTLCFPCESCSVDVPGPRDDNLCRGCGIVVCQTCCDVFEHMGNGQHEKGDPFAQVRGLEHRLADLTAERDRLWEAAEPFADEGRIVAPSPDPNTDPAVVVSLAELEELRAALATSQTDKPVYQSVVDATKRAIKEVSQSPPALAEEKTDGNTDSG